MSDQPEQSSQPITSPPAQIVIAHACEACGHKNKVPVQFGGILQPVPVPPRVQSVDAVTPADVARMRRGPMGLVR